MGIKLHILGFIAIIPVMLYVLWYRPKKKAISFWILGYICSLSFTYVYMILIVQQVGVYELFFTDIMRGSETAQETVDDFMAIYGRKHRHFGHGVFHGVINAVAVGLPFILFFGSFHRFSRKTILKHLVYFIVTSAIIGGCLAQWV